ncbi:hypothetical protein [Micromonospora zhanjiangensis]
MRPIGYARPRRRSAAGSLPGAVAELDSTARSHASEVLTCSSALAWASSWSRERSAR